MEFSILWNQSDSVIYGCSGAWNMYFSSMYKYFSALYPCCSEYHHGRLCPPRAYKAGHSKYLPPMQAEGYVLYSVTGQMLYSQRLFPRLCISFRVGFRHLPSYHIINQIFSFYIFRNHGCNIMAIPHDCTAIRNFKYFFHPMRYVDNGHSSGLQLPYGLKQYLYI